MTVAIQQNEAPAAAHISRPEDVVSIQYLRGLAAVMVVFAHANGQFKTGLHRVWSDFGLSGVDLFFVISGFVMTYTVARHHYSRRQFLLRRVARIGPMYWAMTLLTAALAIFIPQIFQTTHFGLSNFILSLAFFPSRDPVNGNVVPLLHLGWTLNFEMFFYLCFAVLLFRSPLRRALELAAVFAVLVFFTNYTHSNFAPLTVWGNTLSFEFLFGCVVAADYVGGGILKIRLPWLVLLLVLGFGLLVVGGPYDDIELDRWLYRGLPGALIVYSLVRIERLRPFRNYWLHRIGDATYSIYLTHIFVVEFIKKIWQRELLPTTGVASYIFVALCVVAATVVGIIAYEQIELRLNDWAKRRLGLTRQRS